MRRLWCLAMILAGAGMAAGASLYLEAEAFQKTGGWVIDQQSIDIMGSSYLLAHGLGEPVEDAATTVEFPEPGDYWVYVRTKDWVADSAAPGTAGRFQVVIDGKPLPEVFGTKGDDWFWHEGGKLRVEKRKARVVLHDLTGFEGRCDALYFTTEQTPPPNDLRKLGEFRRKALGLPEKPDEAGHFDLVVVGGGVAGTCAAVSAARLGLKVALIQNRPVLGGNSSSEIRVWIQGKTMLSPYPRLGEIVREISPPRRPRESPGPRDSFGDQRKLEVVKGEKNVALYLNHHAYKVETDGSHIRAVIARHTATSREVRFTGELFADCTGDGTIGCLAGADYDMLEKGHMGMSNMWRVADTGKPAPFPRCPWAYDLVGKPFPTKLNRLGRWFWESGFFLHPIRDAERIRDNNFRGMYGAWDCIKNVLKLYPNHKIVWAAYIAGKRESRRLLGDVILTEEDILTQREFPDGCVPSTWPIDLHVPEPKLSGYFPDREFISVAKFKRLKAPYPVPYRCFYSRNVANLFMAGRDISVTHEALGTTRVMATCGMMGEVVGRAAALCRRHNCTPRGVYQKRLDELKKLLQTPLNDIAAPPAPKAPPPFKAPGKNLAREAKVTTSSDYDPSRYPPRHINDGKADTRDNRLRWLSTKSLPNWVEFAWDAPQTIASARIVSGFRSPRGISEPVRDFALQWHDGKTWRNIPGATIKGNTNPYWYGKFKPVTTSRLRLYVTAVGSDITRLWEVEFYPPPPTSQTAPATEKPR